MNSSRFDKLTPLQIITRVAVPLACIGGVAFGSCSADAEDVGRLISAVPANCEEPATADRFDGKMDINGTAVLVNPDNQATLTQKTAPEGVPQTTVPELIDCK